MSSKISLYDNDDLDLITVYLLYQVQKGKKPKSEVLFKIDFIPYNVYNSKC